MNITERNRKLYELRKMLDHHKQLVKHYESEIHRVELEYNDSLLFANRESLFNEMFEEEIHGMK